MLQTLLPPDMTAPVFGILLAVSFATSFVTAAFGLGGGTIMLAVLASLLPPMALIPVHGVVQIGSNIGRAAVMLAHVSWPVVPAFLTGSILGAALGGIVVVNIPPATVQIAVGLFIVWSVFASPPALLRRWGWLSGAVSSFLTMFFGATGLFVATYVRSLDLKRQSFVGTHAALMTVQHGLKSVAFGLLGFAFTPWLALIAGMIAAGFLGTLAGRLVLTRTTDERFLWILDAILLALSARLIWAGAAELF